MKTFAQSEPVVVVIGSGAGGGTVGSELAASGIDVVCLEAGSRLTLGDVVNDDAEMFAKLSWLDPRTGSGGVLPDQFPAWICKTVGGTTMHWAACALRFQEHEWKPRSTYGAIDGANLIDWPIDAAAMAPWYLRAEASHGCERRWRHAALAWQLQLQGFGLRCAKAWLQRDFHWPHGN